MREVSGSFQSTINVASYHGGNDCWVFGAVRPGDRIHSSILGVGGAVLRRTHRQVGSHIPEHHWMGELLTVMEYLPQKPLEQSLKKLMDILREYYEPKMVVMAVRFLFYQRQQQAGKSVAIHRPAEL